MSKKDLTKQVAEWWNKNPFTFGIATSGDQVGRVDFSKMNLDYFNTIERKFRKHSAGGAQNEGMPLFSNLIDYAWLKGKKVLDIGVGSGFSMVAFIQGGAEVTGIDITDYAVRHAMCNLQCRSLQGTVVQMDAQQLAFPSNSFDFVNAWGCLMHVPDGQKAVAEIYRVLKPGGRFLIYLYNKNSLTFWFNFIFLRGILLGKLFYYGFDTDALVRRYTDGITVGGNPYTKVYTRKEAYALFNNAGFAAVESQPVPFISAVDSWPMRQFPFFRYFPQTFKSYIARKWSWALIVRGEK